MQGVFERYGGPIVGTGRVIPTIRSLISIPAGLLKMNQTSFLIWSTIGTAGWTAALATGGWFLGRNFQNVEKILGPVSVGVIVVIVVVYLWRLLTWKPSV